MNKEDILEEINYLKKKTVMLERIIAANAEKKANISAPEAFIMTNHHATNKNDRYMSVRSSIC